MKGKTEERGNIAKVSEEVNFSLPFSSTSCIQNSLYTYTRCRRWRRDGPASRLLFRALLLYSMCFYRNSTSDLTRRRMEDGERHKPFYYSMHGTPVRGTPLLSRVYMCTERAGDKMPENVIQTRLAREIAAKR